MPTPVPTKRWTRTSSGATRPAAADARGAFPPTEDDGFAPAADLAEVLRSTTIRAREILARAPRDPMALRRILFDVAALEREVARPGLRGLGPFVRSLRGRIEAAMEEFSEPEGRARRPRG